MIKTEPELESLPLSLGQQAMYIHSDHVDPVIYHFDMVCLIEGEIELDLLNRCLERVVNDNIVLSHKITSINGELCFTPNENKKTEFKLIDAMGMDHSEIAEMLLASTKKLIKTEPLPSYEYLLIQLSEKFHFLVHQVHHISSDYLGEYNFIRNILECYSKSTIDKEHLNSDKHKPPCYIDYVKREQEYINSDASDENRQFWKEWVQRSKNISMIPYDFDTDLDKKKFTPSIYSHIDPELTSAIYRLAEKIKIAPYRIILSAFIFILSKIQNETQQTIGFSNHGRNNPEDQKMLGYFINTAPFSTSFDPEWSCTEAILKISKDFKDHALHYKYPVSLLSSHVGNSQFRESGNPFFKISMNVIRKNGVNTFLKEEMDFNSFKTDNPIEFEPLKLHRFEGGQRNYAVDDIVIHILEDPEDLTICLNYEGSKYKTVTMERFKEQFVTALSDIVKNPDRKVNSLKTVQNSKEIMDLSECRDISLFNPLENSIPDFIKRWGKATPGNCAVRMGNKTLTYLEMDLKVNSIANLFINFGVKKGETIGVHLDRSLELSPILMGIMRAGAVYLPLDPSYPIGRLEYMVEDSSVKVIVTEDENTALWEGSDKRAVTRSELNKLAGEMASSQPQVDVNPDDQAYVIYTSGSTGKPKGVEVSHRGAINLAYSQKKLFETTELSNILGFASISFDASVWEMLMAFGVGGTFVSASRDEILPGAPLKKVLEENRITHVTLPPSILSHLPEDDFPDLENIIVAGEACSKRLVKTWGKDRKFFNAYGPTETTVCATVARCTPEMHSTPIGRAIGETRVYVLDGNNALVAPGLVGELHVSGPSLALGYRNKPELTGKSFIKNPWGTPPYDRLYKTGDLVRWNSYDQLEYVGRVNTMIKLRGYRIELGEIEANLRDHTDVLEAVVKVIELDGEEPYLAAYLVTNKGKEIDRHEIKEMISRVLPEYMIPSAYVKVDTLPLTTSGKIDKKALPIPAESDRKTTTDIIHISNSYEMIIAEVWKAILNLDHIGKKDNFFDLGGHSLLLLKTQDLIEKTMKVKLSTTDLFKYPTVESLAEWIQKLDMRDDEASVEEEKESVKLNAEEKAAQRKNRQKSLRSKRLKSRR